MSKWRALVTRLRFWYAKQTDPQFMWGHPDEWNRAEWFYYKKER